MNQRWQKNCLIRHLIFVSQITSHSKQIVKQLHTKTRRKIKYILIWIHSNDEVVLGRGKIFDILYNPDMA